MLVVTRCRKFAYRRQMASAIADAHGCRRNPALSPLLGGTAVLGRQSALQKSRQQFPEALLEQRPVLQIPVPCFTAFLFESLNRRVPQGVQGFVEMVGKDLIPARKVLHRGWTASHQISP